MRYDVCVIGAGAAGLILADNLSQRGRRVLLVEGNGVGGERHRVDLPGRLHRGATDGHAFALGGSTTIWGGQLWPWEPYEFEARPHADAWPIGYESVAPYYRAAQETLGVPPSPFDDRLAVARGLRLPSIDPSRFAYKYSKWARWRDRNMGKTVGSSLLRRSSVDVALDERATEVETDSSHDWVSGVRIRDRAGAERTVRARMYVLAGGVLGTVGLLFASGDGGLGNASGQLGRGFMDHLSVRMGEFKPRDPRRFAEAFAPFYSGGVLHTPRIVARPELLEADGLLGVYGHWEPGLSQDSGLAIARGVLRSFQAGRRPDISRSDLLRVAASVPEALRVAYGIGVRRRRPFPRGAPIHLRVDSEQLPASSLSWTSDAEGGRLTLRWNVSDVEKHTVRAFAERLAAELDQCGVGTLEIKDPFDGGPQDREVVDAYHMMGGTRMSAEPSEGVVDPTLRVHGLGNLYVASASVFPSGGMANPTLTILALALRLAQHLDREGL